MTALGVAYAVLAFLMWVGLLVIVAGFVENRADRRVDERVRRRWTGRAE